MCIYLNVGFYLQHIMPPYGTPPHPYVAMYPPGGIYAHPSIPPVFLSIMVLYFFIIMFKTSIICMSDGFALYCMLYSNVYNRDHILLAPLQCLLRMESPRPL